MKLIALEALSNGGNDLQTLYFNTRILQRNDVFELKTAVEHFEKYPWLKNVSTLLAHLCKG